MSHAHLPRRRFLSVLLAPALLLAGMSGAAAAGGGGMGHGHAPSACTDGALECARRATPAFAADGSLWLVVSDESRVHLLRSPDHGRSFGDAVTITPQPVRIDAGADYRPQLVLGPGERVVVGFTVSTDRPFVGDVLYAVSGDGGRRFTPPAPVNVDPAGKRFLVMAADPGDPRRVLATWIDKRGAAAAEAAGRSYAGAALAAAWLDAGTGRFGPVQILQEHTCECCRIAVDYVDTGRPVLVWRNLFGAARDHAILTFAAPDRPGTPHRVSDDDWQIDACPHHGPAVAVADDDSIHAAWFTLGKQRQGLFHARSDDGGRSFSAPRALGDPDRQPAHPQLLAAGKGLWLAWQEYDGQRTQILVEESADGGRSWSEPRVVADSTGTVDQPVLIAGPDGTPYLSWLSRPEGYRLLPLATARSAAR